MNATRGRDFGPRREGVIMLSAGVRERFDTVRYLII